MLKFIEFTLLILFCVILKNDFVDSKYCTKLIKINKPEKVKKIIEEEFTVASPTGGVEVQTRNSTIFVTKDTWITRTQKSCCPGYKPKRGGGCEAECADACENGFCSEPDICKCNEGYKMLSSTRCIPHCENCDHGMCIAPGKCNCNMNYEKSENGTCEPICERGCKNGNCLVPNVCACNDGYYETNSTDECLPFCSNECSENGYCSAPDSCACFDGYRLNAMDECLPICLNGCQFGKCIGPNNCVCEPGYQLNVTASLCEPICIENNCTNGFCDKPNVCKCWDGYRMDESNQCRPICNNICQNGLCKESGICECLLGHQMSKDGNCESVCEAGYQIRKDAEKGFVCQPICSGICENGDCIAPDTCLCKTGYNMTNDPYVCEPICETGCPNGNCSEPEICICDSGYNLTNHRNSCEPICSNGCLNGQCVQPEVCQCNAGYKLNSGFESICQPICDQPVCSDGSICMGPNDCQCLTNYTQNSETGKCVPNCDENCLNGDCLLPYDCVCRPGYKTLDSSGLCQPHCENCAGECKTPGVCECMEGEYNYTSMACEQNGTETVFTSSDESFEMTSAGPSSNCAVNCQDGSCVDDVCVCNEGYRQHNLICIPTCAEDCLHGECISPDYCECQPGYGKSSKYQCSPLCNNHISNGCLNGTCIGPNLCECPSNYELQPGNPFHCRALSEQIVHLSKIQDDLTPLPIIVLVFLVLCLFVSVIVFYFKKYYKSKNYHIADTEARFEDVQYSKAADDDMESMELN